jgi:plastocyanin
MMKNNNAIFYACSATAGAALILIAIAANGSVAVNGSASATLEPAPLSTDDLLRLAEEEERVAVGLGNQTAPINQFSPAAVDIFEGQSVTFYAPPNSTEFHNVIFDLSNGSVISGLELPFILPQGVDPQQLALAPPFNLGQPIIKEQTDGSQAIIAFNKLAFYPGVADQQNNTRYLLDEEQLQQRSEEAMQQGFFFMPSDLSANYTINGTENVVSSGVVLDVMGFGALEEEEPVASLNTTTTEASPATAETGGANTTEDTTTAAGEGEFPTLPYPFLNNFTVTFEQPGTYEYFCAFHPTMIGVVTVAELTASEEEAEQAATTATPPLLQ